MRIIYPNPDGGISVIHPTGELPLEQVALKDTPHGLPYLVVDDADLPADRTFRAAWEAEFSTPHGIGLGPHRWFIQQAEADLVALSGAEIPSFEDAEGDATRQKLLDAWVQGHNAEVAVQHEIIARMKAEILVIEGVQL